MARFSLCDILQMKLRCRGSKKLISGVWENSGRVEGPKPQIMYLNKGQERSCGREKKNNYNTEFILSLHFLFSLQRNCKIHIFIQHPRLIANFCQSVILGLKLLIEQLVKAVCNSCCGNSLHTSAGDAALPHMWPWQCEFGTAYLNIMFADG